jgi:hypothetical protein
MNYRNIYIGYTPSTWQFYNEIGQNLKFQLTFWDVYWMIERINKPLFNFHQCWAICWMNEWMNEQINKWTNCSLTYLLKEWKNWYLFNLQQPWVCVGIPEPLLPVALAQGVLGLAEVGAGSKLETKKNILINFTSCWLNVYFKSKNNKFKIVLTFFKVRYWKC